MRTIDNISRMSTLSRMLKKEGKSIGFVPTMGALHDGHLSLIRTAKQHTDVVVLSIFVNPLQFGPQEDFERYPRDLKRDEELAGAAGVDVIFCPTAKEMYPDGFATYVTVEGLTEHLCGTARPGHFRGVTTVVAKLFGIVRPDVAYFGQKDAQQALVIKRMTDDLNAGVEVKILPIVREKDGLAMSSRNRYLSDAERADAPVLREALIAAEELVAGGERSTAKIIRAMTALIAAHPTARIDYISIVELKTLKHLATITGEALIALAVFFGKTRLIDNTIVRIEAETAPAARVKNAEKAQRI